MNQKSHFKGGYVDLFFGDELIYPYCPKSLWEAWDKYYDELVIKKAIKTNPTKDEYIMLFTDFVKNIG